MKTDITMKISETKNVKTVVICFSSSLDHPFDSIVTQDMEKEANGKIPLL